MNEDPADDADPPAVPQDTDDVVRWCKSILTQVVMGRAYYRTYSALLKAFTNHPSLVRYHDFLEITLTAHLSGLILELSHLVDRNPKTASVHWLLEYAEKHPERFSLVTPISTLRAALTSAGRTVASLRRVRNKMIAHRERLPATDLQALAIEGEALLAGAQALLDHLDTTVRGVLAGDQTCDWDWVMIAVDEETDEVIEALLRGAA